jgi:hypothetical protein
MDAAEVVTTTSFEEATADGIERVTGRATNIIHKGGCDRGLVVPKRLRQRALDASFALFLAAVARAAWRMCAARTRAPQHGLRSRGGCGTAVNRQCRLGRPHGQFA